MKNNHLIRVSIGIDSFGIGGVVISNNGLPEKEYSQVLGFLMDDMFSENPNAKASLSDHAYNAYILALQDIEHLEDEN